MSVVGEAVAQRVERVAGEPHLVVAHRVHAERVEVVDGGAEADRLGDRLRAGLELPRDVVGREAVERARRGSSRRRRGTAASPRAAPGAPTARRCRSGRSILCAENATKSASHACTSVATCGTYWHASTSTSASCACAASASGRMSLIVPSTFDIARDREEPGAVEQLVEVREVEPEVVGHRDPAQLDAALGGEHVPRHDVGVVLHVREHDRRRRRAGWRGPSVYATRLIASVALRVNTISVAVVGVDEARDLGARRLRRRPSPPRRSCTRRGGCWRSSAGSSRPSRRAPRAASATTTRSRGTTSRLPLTSRSRIGKSRLIVGDVERAHADVLPERVEALAFDRRARARRRRSRRCGRRSSTCTTSGTRWSRMRW